MKSSIPDSRTFCAWVKDECPVLGFALPLPHELVLVFKSGVAPPGTTCSSPIWPNRTNVWHYRASAISSGAARRANPFLHPNLNLIALVAECNYVLLGRWATNRARSFLGSGSTLIAAERFAASAAGMELDPLYDVYAAIRRWHAFTGDGATLRWLRR